MRRCASRTVMRRISCTDQRINGRVVSSELVFLGAMVGVMADNRRDPLLAECT